jgi:hypothetical protein
MSRRVYEPESVQLPNTEQTCHQKSHVHAETIIVTLERSDMHESNMLSQRVRGFKQTLDAAVSC